MKWIVGLVALAAIVGAQDAEREKRIAEIRQLEATAEKFLDQGKRAEAFDALARAAVLREALKNGAPEADKPAPSAIEQASAAFEKAVQSGDIAIIRKAAAVFRLAALEIERRQREQLDAERGKRQRLEKRLGELEGQVAALKKLLEG